MNLVVKEAKRRQVDPIVAGKRLDHVRAVKEPVSIVLPELPILCKGAADASGHGIDVTTPSAFGPSRPSRIVFAR
jgi:hypothetical protein